MRPISVSCAQTAGLQPSFEVDDLLARLESVVLGEEAPHGVGKQLLLFVVVEVHVPSYSPSVILEMMFRWISFEPA